MSFGYVSFTKYYQDIPLNVDADGATGYMLPRIR
jgi:hypothetical protein